MFDPMGKPMTVNVDSQFLANSQNQLVAGHAQDHSADWATVLEKAVMKYNAIYHFSPYVDVFVAMSVVPLFTGNGDAYEFRPGVLTPDQLTRLVVVSLAQGMIAWGGFVQKATIGADLTDTGHAYTVLPPPDAASMMSVRNPWGRNPTPSGVDDTSADGVMNLPATTSTANLVWLIIAARGAS
jgi:hypothetical protein